MFKLGAVLLKINSLVNIYIFYFVNIYSLAYFFPFSILDFFF